MFDVINTISPSVRIKCTKRFVKKQKLAILPLRTDQGPGQCNTLLLAA